MNGENINKTQTGPRVLVAPLDWGLGHATRCIPIINHLISNGATVLLAAEGGCASLLSAEFPQIKILHLDGYRVKYHAGKSGFVAQMFRQLPRLLGAIRSENKWLNELIKEENIDVVISDNRYGLYNSKAYTIIVTHQLRIQTGYDFADSLIQGIHYRYLRRFNECWVPDEEESPGLGHGLSHPKRLPAMEVRYMGLLSRLQETTRSKFDFNWLIILSGPEPQRTLWENMLLNQHQYFQGPVAILRGLPQGGDRIDLPAGWTGYDHMPSSLMNELLQSSNKVLCRSGYSTLMDLRATGKKALIVATPGQREQEYLARKNNGVDGFISADQYGDNWPELLGKLEMTTEPKPAETKTGTFIRQWMDRFLNLQREK